MARKVKKNKKALSKVKRSNIKHNKLANQGIFAKLARKQRIKKKKVEERKEKSRKHVNTQKSEQETIPDVELTAEDMLEMMDVEDLSLFNKCLDRTTSTHPVEETEKTARSFNDEEVEKQSHLLPIMTEEGWMQRTEESWMQRNVEKPISKMSFKAKMKLRRKQQASMGQDSKVRVTKTVVQILAERERSLHDDKVQMACLALNVIQDSTKLNNLQSLLLMLEEKDPATEVTARKYTTLTLLQVFHELIPSYSIQEKAGEIRLKKETYSAFKIELELLKFYRRYLKALEDILLALKDNPGHMGLLVLSETSLYCLGDLLHRHSYFNYTFNIIQAMVPYLNHSNSRLRKVAYEALSHTIKNDLTWNLTQEIVRRIYTMAHRFRFKIKGELLRIFLSFRFKELRNEDAIEEQGRSAQRMLSYKDKLVRKLSEKSWTQTSRKQKRANKKKAKIREQMAEINAQEIQNVKNVKHSAIVQDVFGLYFHILKKKHSSKLVSVVLEGLARFAHLINIEFFSDLMDLLSRFLDEGTLGQKESLYCINTIFTVLSGQGQHLNIDPQRFYRQFYVLLMDLTLVEYNTELETILNIVDKMLLMRKRQVSSSNVLSFTKRLASLALTLPHHSTLPLLVTLKKVFSTFSASDALLDTDTDGSPGLFRPEIPDPDHANTSSSSLWDLIPLKRHYHPSVRIMANNILTGVSAREVPAVHAITKLSYEQLQAAFSPSTLKFNPRIPSPSEHLQAKKSHGTKPANEKEFLGLQDWRLRGMCEQIVAEDESVPEPVANEQSSNSFQFYEGLFDREDSESLNNELPKSKKFNDMSSYFIGGK